MARRHGREEPAHQTHVVIEREPAQRRGSLRPAVVLQDQLEVRAEVPVGDLDPLRIPGASGRELDEDHIVLLYMGGRDSRGRHVRIQPRRVRIDHQPRIERGVLGDGLGQRSVGQQPVELEPIDQPDDLPEIGSRFLTRHLAADGHGQGAHPDERQEGADHVDVRDQRDDDAIARLDVLVAEVLGVEEDPPVEVGVGVVGFLELSRDQADAAIGMEVPGRIDDVDQRRKAVLRHAASSAFRPSGRAARGGRRSAERSCRGPVLSP